MIIDASPIIIFGKLNRLELLKKIFHKLIISNAVYDEIVKKGGEINAADALIVKDYIEKGNIEIKSLEEKWREKSEFLKKIYPQIDLGESEVISLALQEKEKMVVIDEISARKVAELEGLLPIGSLGTLLLAFKNNLIKENELREAIEKMINMKFRIGADVINEFWNIFDKLKKKK